MKQGFRKFETKKKLIFSSNNPYTVDLDRSFSVMVAGKAIYLNCVFWGGMNGGLVQYKL